jgi:putative aminopeptidase FrvX
LGQYFTQPEHRLRNVELWVGGFGSEECGERGACAFVKKYGEEGLLDNSFAVIPESCGAGDRLAIITKEPIHLAVHDLELCEKVYEGYQEFVKEKTNENPIPCKVEKLPFSASDAGRFSLKGYKATMVIAFEGALAKPKNWHDAEDKPANLEVPMMATVFGTFKHYIQDLDKKLEEKMN